MPKLKNNKLTAKQQTFVEAYTNTNAETFNNGIQSAKAAGYKGNPNVLRAIACENLTKPYIKNAIQAKRAESQRKAEYNRQIAIEELNKCASYLQELAAQGNVGAVSALTAVIREKNEISGLHKRIIIDETDQQRELAEAEKAEAKRLANIRLHRTGT